MAAPATCPLALRARIRRRRFAHPLPIMVVIVARETTMETESSARRERRCIGLDVHREFAQVAIWQGGLVCQAGRFATTPEGVRAFAEGLGPADEVALEATGNTWAIATLLASRAGRVVVSNPAKTRAIAGEAKVKTDKVDAEILAQLLAADYLPRGVAPGPGHGGVAPPGAAPGAPRAPAHPVEEPGACDLAPQPDSALPAADLF